MKPRRARRKTEIVFIALAAITGFLPQGFLFSYEKDNPLIAIEKIDPSIRVEIRYATKDNFMHEVLYPEAKCLVRAEMTEALRRIQSRLRKSGLCLKIFDGYRPLSVQKKMWAKFPMEGFVADPAKGSNHNRGMALDVTLTDLETGQELEMPSVYDEFSERAHRDYAGGTERARANRKILEEAMEAEGFRGIRTEWWHFDYKDAKKYPVLDLPFSVVSTEDAR